jgi:hypothetical protein
MAGRFFRGSLSLALAGLVLIALGCGSASLADDYSRALPTAARRFGQSIPEQQLPGLRARADEIGQRLAQSVERRAGSYQKARELLQSACEAMDGGIPKTPGQKLRELAEDLQQAEDSRQDAQELAVFTLCEIM